MAGFQFFHALQDAQRAGYVTHREVAVQGISVNAAINRRIGHQGFQLRCEAQLPCSGLVKEGFFSCSISRDEQAARPHIPDAQGEHAIELGQEGTSPMRKRSEHDLGVGA